MANPEKRNSQKQESDIAAKIMAVMVRMPPETHKSATKPKTAKGEAQRRRRQKERLTDNSLDSTNRTRL
jgi:hypothetical protein